jgi:hypothetical protein
LLPNQIGCLQTVFRFRSSSICQKRADKIPIFVKNGVSNRLLGFFKAQHYPWQLKPPPVCKNIKIIYYNYGADWRTMVRRHICLTGPFSGGSLSAAGEQQ